MVSITQAQAFQLDLENILNDFSKVGIGERLHPCDALFAYRILLGRMPSSVEEINSFFSSVSHRQFFKKILESREFAGQLGFMPGGHLMMTDVNGFRFWFNSSDREMGALMATARYEQETINLIRKIVKPGMFCIDVGAQTGYFTCLLSSIVGQNGFVWAFEPLPESFEMINANIKENRFESNVKLYPVACAEKSGELAADCASGMVVASPNGAYKFKSVAIDDVVNEQIDFCKIDIEGHEPSAIKGMHKLLNRCHPVILTEFNQYWLKQAGSSITDYADLLRSYDYILYNVSVDLTLFNDKADYDALSNFNVIALPHGVEI